MVKKTRSGPSKRKTVGERGSAHVSPAESTGKMKKRNRPSAATVAKPTHGTDMTRLTVRHYCQGIGDCHLIRIPKSDGTDFFMLIDCGIHSSVRNGNETIQRIVEDIASVTTHIDVAVGTHEHWDHLSGFLTAAEAFDRITFDEVWLAWTENPADPQGRQLDKFKRDAMRALDAAGSRLAIARALTPHLASVQQGLEALRGFVFGAKGERVRDARNNLVKKGQSGKNGVKYLEPSTAPITLSGVPDLRIYVLGPPRDPKLLGITESSAEMYGMSSSSVAPLAVALGLSPSTGEEMPNAAPFDPSLGSNLSALLDPDKATQSVDKLAQFFQDHYAGPTPPEPDRAQGSDGDTDQSWRRIDADWLGVSSDLAIQLDSKTNNSSLVLAFEFADTRRVLLFAADAQVGNWLSWQKLTWNVDSHVVTGPDLLARTVYYKVGHHGSHNATLKEHGLEQMKSGDLSAFIPTNKMDAKKVGWGEMPFDAILEDLEKRTSGRVVRADDPWVRNDTNSN